MNQSLSEQVLQKLKLHQRKSQHLYNPQIILNKSLAIKTQYLYSTQSPAHLNYNQIIHDHESKSKGRYKLRNCRQPTLKIVQRKSLSRQKANSLLGLKQLMKQQMQRFSIKKKYQSALQKYANNQIAQSLKLDLLFLPSSVKIPHKNRYRPNRQIPKLSNMIEVNGNRLLDKNKFLSPKYMQNQKIQVQFPDMPKKTAGYQLKYRRNYLNKKKQVNQQNDYKIQINNLTQPTPLKQEEFVPLTGWQ